MRIVKPPLPLAPLASARTGILKHGEHLVDLVLDIVPGTRSRQLPGFTQFTTYIDTFVNQIETQEIAVLNEKFDGSPALLLGYDGSDRPYVAYKHGIGSARGPRIVRNVKEARQIFSGSAMREIFEDCIRYLRPRLLKFKNKDLAFQADLLFTPNNGAIEVSDKEVIIRANPFGIEYHLPTGSKFYEFAKRAKVGLVVHTVGRRVIDEDTKEIVGVSPLEDADLVEEFVKALRSEDVFVIDPWSRRVRIDRGENSLSEEKEKEIYDLLRSMRAGLEMLTTDFRTIWKTFLPHFKVFLNSSLKEGKSGGIYRAAADDANFDFKRIVSAFSVWITERSQTVRISPKGVKRKMAPAELPINFELLQLGWHRIELCRYLKAYFDAVRIQYLLKPHMREVYSSKLGGGQIEGIMITDDETQIKVKLVDRLEFTMQNFSGEKKRKIGTGKPKKGRGRVSSKREIRMPQLYRKWRAGAAFFIGKMQPPHAGHIAMLGAAIAEFGVENVFIMPSDKAPDLTADNWKDLGVAERKRDLAEGNFTHVFSPELREKILRHGLPDEANIHFANTSTFWRYLARATRRNSRGEVALIMGQKEIEEGRYRKQLERFRGYVRPHAIDMQRDGLSATDVRQAIKMVHNGMGNLEAYLFLQQALEFIPPKERDRIIGQLIKEWSAVEKAVARAI
jgi:hypothetical protein